MPLSMKDLGIHQMNADDRLALVEEIWDSLAGDVAQTPISEAQRSELERRLAAHKAAPGDVVLWEEVKAQALARARQ